MVGTDDGDLKFNYLSNFGPRFRKLADMYGEDPSDEESDGVGERESESWCWVFLNENIVDIKF